MSHPLDNEFDITDSMAMDDDYEPVKIPEDAEERNLDLIIDLALRTYKEQMDDMVHIEPKNRLKYLEIAERFLNQAKDAMYKKDYLRMQRERKNSATRAPQTPQGGDQGAQNGDGTVVDRKALMERMRLVSS